MKRLNKKRQMSGSALIMAVVLTVLLSIVGIMFIMVARMDKAATNSIIENKELKSAVDSVIEIISQQLVLDTPGVARQEYYDYPGDKDEWLASIEPYKSGSDYYWPQISDITGYLTASSRNFITRDVPVEPEGLITETVVREYPIFDMDSDGRFLEVEDNGSKSIATEGVSADADGDGIADSKWIELKDMRTSKGQKIYAAIRVIDNSAMLNINTAYQFDANSSDEDEIDGSTQAQINLKGLLKGTDDIDDFHQSRCGTESTVWNDPNYIKNIIWNFTFPKGGQLPFDISDELELRYRYCVDGRTKARIEEPTLPKTIRGAGWDDYGNVYKDLGDSGIWGLDEWRTRITDPNETDLNSKADRRHLLTTYNLDRVIDPNGKRMFSTWVNRDPQALYERLKSCIDRTLPASEQDDKEAWLAQISANIVDYSDDDANVSVVKEGSDEYYGFERPFIYISEITRRFEKSRNSNDPNIYKSYAVELYKNFDSDEKFDDWELRIGSDIIPIRDFDFEQRGGNYYVIVYENSMASLADRVKFRDSPNDGATGVDPDVRFCGGQTWFGVDTDGNNIFSDSYDVYFGTSETSVTDATISRPLGVLIAEDSSNFCAFGGTKVEDTTYYWRVDAWYNRGGDPCEYQEGSVQSFTTWPEEPNSIHDWTDPCDPNGIILRKDDIITLSRKVDGASVSEIDVDSKAIYDANFSDPSITGIYSYQRDIGRNNRLKRLWYFDTGSTLGHWNNYPDSPANPIQPFHSGFRTIGEIGKVFRKSTYIRPSYRFNYNDTPLNTEKDVRIDLHDPDMQKVFQYLTVMDPDRFAGNDANETRVKGRLNINTAPKFLIQQLPWVTPELAEAIIAYRDMTTVAGETSINYDNRNTATDLVFADYPLRDELAFASIGELMTVINKDSSKKEYSIQKYGLDNTNQRGFPDISIDGRSKTDSAANDLEERELIFARISDLVTVRSDVFTAYVLVRLGTDGPQKRVVAILDRSGVKSETDKVKIRALQLTPDPR